MSCEKLAGHIAFLHHIVSSTEQHESLKEDTLFTQQLFRDCFVNFLLIATDYFHRLKTINRLLFPKSASGRIKLLFLKKRLIFLRSTVLKTCNTGG